MSSLHRGIRPLFLRSHVRHSSNLKSWPKYARGNWTPKVPAPPYLDHAGDISLDLPKINSNRYRPSVALSDLIDDADQLTKRMLSLELAPAKLAADHLKSDFMKKFQRYPGDTESLEVKVVNATVFIRKYAAMCNKNTADKVAKVKLLHAISQRHRLLTKLRWQNYDRFQYCLKELQIKWTPRVETAEERRRPTKREVAMKEVVDESESLKEQKLKEVRERYEEELDAILKQKDGILEDIALSMKQFNISTEDVFFNDGAVKPVDFESKINAEQKAKWNEAEKQNLVKWMRVLKRPTPKMAFLTAHLLQTSESKSPSA